jgi:hypothetical protein
LGRTCKRLAGRIASLVVFAIVAVFAAPAMARNPLFPIRQPPGVPASAQAMIGDAAAEILQNPTRVTVFRLDPSVAGRFDRPNVEGFAILGESLVQEPARVKALRTLLLDDAAYDFSQWNQDKWCGDFAPGLAVRVQRDERAVNAMVCFKCGDIAFSVYDARKQRVHATYADFTPSRDRWRGIAKEHFPDAAWDE